MYTEKVDVTECIKMSEVIQVMEDRCVLRWASIREQAGQTRASQRSSAGETHCPGSGKLSYT